MSLVNCNSVASSKADCGGISNKCNGADGLYVLLMVLCLFGQIYVVKRKVALDARDIVQIYAGLHCQIQLMKSACH
jgi:hypothetical protein